MHASFAGGGLPGKFASFLIMPDQSGTAARHYARDAIVDAYQLCGSMTVVSQVAALIPSAGAHHISGCLFHHSMAYIKQKPVGDKKLVKIRSIKVGLLPGQE